MLQIDGDVLEEADKEVKPLKEQGKRIVCIWDGRVREKPESRTLEGLCPVVSRKAKRLHRSSKGLVFNFPPRKPGTVTGMQWTGAFITAMEGMLHVALMSWWSTKAENATRLRTQEEALVRKCVRPWGEMLLHLFDRGYASGPWIQLLQFWKVRFVSRWKKGPCFCDAKGDEKKLWQMGRGKKYCAHTHIPDVQTGEKMPCALWWAPRRHAAYASQLYLVSRSRQEAELGSADQ
jgi:hypothetical protein